MTNRLAQSSSPYLLQHAENPVDWYPWSDEALQKARQENKPIFLSIGYAACHWCHVMAHESFEDTQISAIMNEHFVNIKVDREERPDLDNIYMKAVVALTGQGGWPMSVFLTPDGKPFYGGTYYPPVRRYNMPSFKEVLIAVSRSWKENQDQIQSTGQKIADHLQSTVVGLTMTGTGLDTKKLEHASMALAQAYDWRHGGWGSAPKFPQAMAIDFLFSRATRGDRLALDIAIHALDAMSKGGIYDVIGGGFARYSVDNDWLVPHFEKMLYDNAQLARVYLHGFLLTGEKRYRQICEETMNFIQRDMANTHGGFFSSMDADSEGVEGKYYVWTPDEIRSAIEDDVNFELFLHAYGVTEDGNFDGTNVLQKTVGAEELGDHIALPPQEVENRLNAARRSLLNERNRRVAPGIDDKVLTSWNALMSVAFAEAGRYLGRHDYVKVAIRNIRFLLNNLVSNGTVYRSWRAGQANIKGFLEDYSALIWALLTLYQSNPQTVWFHTANQVAQSMIVHFRDPAGGFFDTRDDHEKLLVRPKELQDNATPSGNSLAVTSLLQLAAITGRGDWRDLAEEALMGIQDTATRYPTAFGQWLYAMDFALGPVQEVAILGDYQEQAMRDLIDALWSDYRPRTVAAISAYPPDPSDAPLLKNRPLKNDLPTAYVCQDFVCEQPVNDPNILLEQLV